MDCSALDSDATTANTVERSNSASVTTSHILSFEQYYQILMDTAKVADKKWKDDNAKKNCKAKAAQ